MRRVEEKDPKEQTNRFDLNYERNKLYNIVNNSKD